MEIELINVPIGRIKTFYVLYMVPHLILISANTVGNEQH